MKKIVVIVGLLLVVSGCCNCATNDYQCLVDTNRQVKVEACNLSGERKANVKVNIGNQTKNIKREYYAYTNQYKQVVYVSAKELILQTKAEENHNGRLCEDEADVSGTEKKEYDQGHIIADALGGVSNAYNITPENSYLNRKGSKYNLEQEWINALRNNQKITNVKVEIIYPNNYTQTPSKYKYSWEVDGSKRSLEIDNIAY